VKCAKCDCETAETVSANHPGASQYCRDCGACQYCGESVEFFEHCEDLGIWICPCVKKRRKEKAQPRPEYQPVPVAKVEKKTKSKRDHWQRTA
jgi:hypothetical protein